MNRDVVDKSFAMLFDSAGINVTMKYNMALESEVAVFICASVKHICKVFFLLRNKLWDRSGKNASNPILLPGLVPSYEPQLEWLSIYLLTEEEGKRYGVTIMKHDMYAHMLIAMKKHWCNGKILRKRNKQMYCITEFQYYY